MTLFELYTRNSTTNQVFKYIYISLLNYQSVVIYFFNVQKVIKQSHKLPKYIEKSFIFLYSYNTHIILTNKIIK
jgi:hypothetical protein